VRKFAQHVSRGELQLFFVQLHTHIYASLTILSERHHFSVSSLKAKCTIAVFQPQLRIQRQICLCLL